MKAGVYHKTPHSVQPKWNFIMLKALRLPAVCRICRQYHANHHAICEACTALLDPLGFACQTCAIPILQPDPALCGACAVKPPHLNRILTAYRFTEPLRTLLHAFKYEAALYLTSFLAHLMLQAKPEHYVTNCLIPIPMHVTRLHRRGFNQAAVLTQYLGKMLGIPYELDMCTKVLATPAQAGLPAQQRHTNLIQAFSARSVPYPHVTLIDDLFTTGATANEVAKTLKQQAGVRQVDLWCCARAC